VEAEPCEAGLLPAVTTSGIISRKIKRQIAPSQDLPLL
jgi:hypothetical protein